MLKQNEKLAQALEILHRTAADGGVVQSSELSRTYRDRLVKAGFLEEIIRGWLLVTNPAAPNGSSATWYGSFWEFVAKYLDARFDGHYCLSAEASIKLHVRSTVIPTQLLVTVQSPLYQVVNLKHGTSIAIYQVSQEVLPTYRTQIGGVWAMDLATAICRLSPTFFKTNHYDAEIALRMVREPSSLLRILLGGSNVVVAGRLVGAYTFIGQTKMAAQIKQAMELAGNTVRVSNPFENPEPVLRGRPRITSPHAARIQALWSGMRSQVLDAFDQVTPRKIDTAAYLAEMDERYVADAYNSLSIEGYRVTPDLIERVRTNDWNPDESADKQELSALAARGYYQAFQAVRQSITRILSGEPSAEVIDSDFQQWYGEMFSPSVRAGLLQAEQLAGYRNIPVYLRGSRHVPPASDAVADCMDAFRDLMAAETEAIVRAVLGHYVFVYVHPYPDGNGRIGRFIMNAALSAGGYPWTVIRQSHRDEYLAALEEATISQSLRPFAEFVLQEMLAPVDNEKTDETGSLT